MSTVVRYMPQFEVGLGWVDMFTGLGFHTEAEAQRYVAHSTVATRYVQRVVTETVPPFDPERDDAYEVPPVTPKKGIHGGGTALAVKAYNGHVEVGWSEYSIEQADELIAAIQRAQLKAAEQR